MRFRRPRLVWWSRRVGTAIGFFVLPTLQNASVLAMFDAMFCGLPVAATTSTGFVELGEDSRDGLIVPAGDAAALTAAIHRLLDQPELRRQLGVAARAKVQGAHLWDDYRASVLQAVDARRAQAVQRNF